MITISVKLPEWMIKLIDDLVHQELYSSRSEFIREAIRAHLKKYLGNINQSGIYVSIPQD